jgi:hypothetical protein
LTVRVALVATGRKDHFIDLTVDVVSEGIRLTGWQNYLGKHHGIEDVAAVTNVGVSLPRE